MALDWTTFVLEMINFLVLLWLLKHFLYKPVLDILARRQAGIERTLNEAQEKETFAATLQSQYESRLADWEQEKKQARIRLDAEMSVERERQLAALRRDLAIEQERNTAQETHRQELLKRELTAQCNEQARQFTSKLLSKLAGPDLEARLVTLFIDELAVLSEERIAPLQTSLHDHSHGSISSAYPLTEQQRQQIVDAIRSRLKIPEQIEFIEDSSLLAGLRVTLDAWQLDFSLAGELSIYAEEYRVVN